MNASALVAAAVDLAAAFDRGGRLLAVGDGRASADARHVAVEFLHPVIVGRRALPAAVGADRVGPDDVVVAIGYGDAPVRGRADIAITDRPVPDARHVIELPGADPLAAKEAALAAYHVLWELVHLFLGGATTAGAGGAGLDALYPMLGGSARSDETHSAAIVSTEEKLADTVVVRARALADNDTQLDVAARLLADAPTVFTFGNGGSASDASDLAIALAPKGWALSDDVATVTALANDVSFDVVFARQLVTLSRAGDVAVALSTSGTSPNILAGMSQARQLGLGTIAIAGYDGGDLANAGLDVCCVVRSTSIHRIQEAYVTLYDEMLRRAGLC